MIQNTKGKLAAQAVLGRFGKGFPADLITRTRALLSAMQAAAVIDDLRFPPGNRLEALSGDRQGQHSVRINGQWRICSCGRRKVPPTSKSWIIIEDIVVITLANPSHPGAVLEELFLKPLDMNASALAKRLQVPRTRIERLIKEQTALTADTALRLSRFFGNTAEFWLNLQRAFDLAAARETIDVSDIKPLKVA